MGHDAPGTYNATSPTDWLDFRCGRLWTGRRQRRTRWRIGEVEEAKLQKILPELFPLRPTNIRRALKLNRPIYRRTAAYGHFGRAPEKDGGFSWERTDLADALKRSFR